MKRLCIILLGLFIAALPLSAVKARPGVFGFRQPDGTVVRFVIRGDERAHVAMTTDGCAISLDGNAICYARYDEKGIKHSTGIPVGPDAPQEVVKASRLIPQSVLRPGRRFEEGFPQAQPALLASKTDDGGMKSGKALVLLIEFPDLKFTHTREQFVNMLNMDGYSFEGATGSAMEYFNYQFAGKMAFSFDVSPIVTADNGYAYYGQDNEAGEDMHPAELIAEACRKADDDVDFSQYDFIYVFYAGGNPADYGADDDHIWPHSWNLLAAGIVLRLDGKFITNYATSSELMSVLSSDMVLTGHAFTGIGTFCHEFSHVLGLMDMYDVDGEKSGGRSNGLWGSTSLMDTGNYNNGGRTPPCYNAIELEMLGLMEAEPITSGLYTLMPLTRERRALRFDGNVPDEYYLFECRKTEGWDRYIGGSGMLVYHIDRSEQSGFYSERFERNLTPAQRWNSSYNEVNCRPDHECADLVEAFPGASEVKQVFFPYASRNAFGLSTDPAFVFWNGDESPYSIADIKLQSGGDVLFTVNGPISLDINDVFQDAAILNWHTDVESCKALPCQVTWKDPSGVSNSVSVDSYDSGKYSFTIEGLSPSRTYDLTICYLIDGEETYPFNMTFTTAAYGGLPYIYMGSSSRRNSSVSLAGKIPLRVMNAQGAKSISWSFDGRDIATGPDGYFEPGRSGLLKARVVYGDGTEEIIVRRIVIK